MMFGYGTEWYECGELPQKKHPVCDDCGDEIYTDTYYLIDGKYYCEDCMEAYKYYTEDYEEEEV